MQNGQQPTFCLSRTEEETATLITLSSPIRRVRVDFFEDFAPGRFKFETEVCQDACGNAVCYAQQPEEDMFGSHVGMA